MQDFAVWRDPSRSPAERASDLLDRMTLPEKIGQLYGVWVGLAATEDAVAPHQHDFAEELPDWKPLIENGLGQLTRPFGTVPTDPAVGARALARTQAEIIAAGRFGVPALVHEECLSGFTAWGATIFPTPLAWGATFDPELIEKMSTAIGTSMRGVGVHQGLAPVLDVCRDPRWGRTEETIGEDPYLVGTIGSAYVRGLESAGIVATLKHFVGYSASRGARNLGPTGVGARELADVLLPPFEHALRAGARSVMHSYTELDGVPTASDGSLLSGLLRETWGFEGTVVADYFAVSFLHLLHGVAESPAAAAGLALSAGIDVELPTVRCFGDPLLQAVVDGTIDEALVDRAAERVLRQKCELGLLDPGWEPTPESVREEDEEIRGTVDFDPPEARVIARQLAEESVVLLQNKEILPLQAGRVALVGPLADDPMAMLGCYTFPSHVGSRHPDLPLGVAVPTVRAALAAELPTSELEYALGCDVSSSDRSGIEAAVALARSADVCVAVVGDRAGLFGRGTSGEGCDAEDLSLPGEQGALVEALLDSGTPVVLVLLTGRPYALGAYADRTAAIVQAFFPGEEGANAVAGVLSGRVNPSGRLPIGIPQRAGGQPYSYLAPPLGQRSEVSNLDPTPRFPFGHGLSYTTFEWSEPAVSAESFRTDEAVDVEVTVRNVGDRAGTEVVQLYLHDPVAQVTRPVARLIGYARVPLEPGEQARVRFEVHADLTSFTGRRGVRVVEPGELELRLSTACTVDQHLLRVRLVDKEREVDHRRHLAAGVRVDRPKVGGDG
jgi:beta-xylosidase